jgi:hypothetical protein
MLHFSKFFLLFHTDKIARIANLLNTKTKLTDETFKTAKKSKNTKKNWFKTKILLNIFSLISTELAKNKSIFFNWQSIFS